MNRRSRLILVAGMLTALVSAGGAAVAVADPATTGRVPSTMHVRAVFKAEKFLDAEPAGTSLGDEQLASGTLYNPSGREMGTFGFICTTVGVTATHTLEQCAGWGLLADGQLEFAGMSRDTDTTHTWGVTGGTGAYTTARGTLISHDLSDTLDAVTIELR
jgi:hypothetical protein